MTNLTNSELIAGLGLPQETLNTLQSAEGTEFVAAANDFISALVNKIVYQKVDSMEFNNPFKKFYGFKLKAGDTIENVFVDLPDGYTYDPNATDPFTKYVPNVKSLYATLNYQRQYPQTIQLSTLRRAVLSESGLTDLANRLISRFGVKKSIDEYTATIAMLNNSELYADGFETLDLSKETTSVGVYKEVARKIKNVVNDFALPCVDNNKARVLNVTPKSKCLLVIKQSILDNIDIDYLAGVFNLSKTEMVNNIIAVRDFKVPADIKESAGITTKEYGDDLDFVIIDTQGFDIHPYLEDNGVIYNPKGKYTNYYADDWLMFGFKYWFNARAFKITLPE